MNTLNPRRRPRVSPEQAVMVLDQDFGVRAGVAPLPSERDQNFKVSTEAEGAVGVLKISHPDEDPSLLDLQDAVLHRLRSRVPGYTFPQARPTTDGRSRTSLVLDDHAVLVRLMTWVPGVPHATARPRTLHLAQQVGEMLGETDRALETLEHPAAARPLRWDLQEAQPVISDHLHRIGDQPSRDLVAHLADRVGAGVSAVEHTLRRSIIHNDANDYNVLVADVRSRPGRALRRRVRGLIDFGDVVRTWTVAEPAIACAYTMLDRPDPLAAAAALVRGYHTRYPLEENEVAALPHLIVERLLVSVSLSAAQRAADPTNDYLSISESPAWELLHTLRGNDPEFFTAVLRHACDWEPHPRSRTLVGLLADLGKDAAPVLVPDPAEAKAVVFDLSVGSLDLRSDADALDAEELSVRLFRQMDEAGAQVGLGRYDEARRWYDGDAYAVPGREDERRTLHLGVDLFASRGTAVQVPLDGVVHSVANNDGPLDYGPTLILEHDTGPSGRFYTLYGHLASDVLQRLSPGQPVRAGETVAALGGMEENGGWPPHLHFQILTSLFGHQGTFPGVAPPSERGFWLSVCPDPNLLLGIPGLGPAHRGMDIEAILEERGRRLGPSLSVSYRSPLKIVRGESQFLLDDMGRRYLDCVNNVAHVGHCHPRVVAAAARQMGVLNTNTRYLHENVIRYAARLAATLPESLEVCFFVCSGSEANELALRLARTHTGSTDVVVVDAAYHGNTSSLIDLSPYKFDGPGGGGAPDHVHTVRLPDPYRGVYREGDGDVGVRYATSVVETLERLAEKGRAPAAFFCESILSCGGQIVLPDGYLHSAVGAVRGAGGVYVADEVQVGFGRVGERFWAFETQGVVPDIVTMGKPIGNGHPLGAVVTTRAIAESFTNGMEYFNTFGGNPVSCAVGLAVLDVIEEEGLQASARSVGGRLKRGLEGLMDRHPLVGDVRGLGLFLGMELVLDRTSRAPAPDYASLLVERMRENGILLSTDGPDHNVLKIKPPMTFAPEDADRVIATLDHVLSEDAFIVEP